MIRNLFKAQASVSSRLPNKFNQFMCPNLIQRPKFNFSSEDPKNNNKNDEEQQKNKKIVSEAQRTSFKYIKSFIEGVKKRNHSTNSPLLKSMMLLQKLQRSISQIGIKGFTKINYGFGSGGQNNNSKRNLIMLFLSLLTFSLISLKLDQQKMPKQDPLLSKANLNQNNFRGRFFNNELFEEQVSQIRKVKFISIQTKQIRNLSRAQRQQIVNKGTYDNDVKHKDKKDHPLIQRIVYYRIQMQDNNGKKYIAEPYLGDPNKLITYFEDIKRKYHRSEKIEITYENTETYKFNNALSEALEFFYPFIPIALTIFIFRMTDPTSFLKKLGKQGKQFKIQAMKNITTRFNDVAGMEQAKKQVTQFVDFLKNNQKYTNMGAKIPKGALLTGPPGTGKTMLARACAGEAGVSFYYISGSQFVQIFVGLGASKVRDLFASARQNAPSIIFIDQIDAIGKKRQNSRNEQKDSTLNQLLVQMDGFSSNETIVVLAATNRKQILDNALTRPGRFDRMVEINLPDVAARQQIFMVHLKPLKIDPNTQMRLVAKRLAELSPGFSGADISNLCNEAAIIATRKNKNYIESSDFEEATQRITAGYVKKNLMKQKTKKRVAYHESGHAVSSWFLRGGDPLVKLTIIPRSKGALGYAQYLPKTIHIRQRSELIDKVAIMLGGITTEQMFFGQISSGGSDDLQKVYSLTRQMVTQFGMGKQTYNVTMDEESYIQKQSNYLSDKMEGEIADILEEARNRSRSILQSKRDVIEALAKELMEKETINKDDILKIMGNRPDFQQVKEQILQREQETKQKTFVL